MVSKIWNLLSPQDQHAQGIKSPMDTFLLVVDLGIFPILLKLVLWLTMTPALQKETANVERETSIKDTAVISKVSI